MPVCVTAILYQSPLDKTDEFEKVAPFLFNDKFGLDCHCIS